MTKLPEADDLTAISNLKGKTLLVYGELLRLGHSVGVRELQRILGFSSPSVSAYHLDKLFNLGLVEKDRTGAYFLSRKLSSGMLTQFWTVRILNRMLMLPRIGGYAAFVSVLTLGYFFFFAFPISIASGIALLFLFLIASALWFETYRVYLEKPF